MGLSIAQITNPCSGNWFGEIVAHPTRCDAYYICLLTVPNLRTCNTGNVFDLSARACVPGDQETCEIFGSITTTSTQPPPPSLEEICLGLFFEARPYPGSTTQFVGCIRGSGVLFTCHQDEIFDNYTNECLKVMSTTEHYAKLMLQY